MTGGDEWRDGIDAGEEVEAKAANLALFYFVECFVLFRFFALCSHERRVLRLIKSEEEGRAGRRGGVQKQNRF